jgi:hypothetical protein
MAARRISKLLVMTQNSTDCEKVGAWRVGPPSNSRAKIEL